MTILQRTGKAAKAVGRFYVWTVVGDLREVRDNASRLRDRFNRMRHRAYRTETFSEAVARQGLTAADLQKRQSVLNGIAFTYGIILILALVFLMLSPLSDHPIRYAALSLGVVFVALPKFLASRFRVSQIRERELFGFKEWLWGKRG